MANCKIANKYWITIIYNYLREIDCLNVVCDPHQSYLVQWKKNWQTLRKRHCVITERIIVHFDHTITHPMVYLICFTKKYYRFKVYHTNTVRKSTSRKQPTALLLPNAWFVNCTCKYTTILPILGVQGVLASDQLNYIGAGGTFTNMTARLV